MKKAFITTVFNEERTIGQLLESLLSQTEIPDEIIIVDAYSKDGTSKKINYYQKKFPSLNIKFFKKKGNRSKGRNLAISMATSDIIAVSDSGCILKEDWFFEITKPFKKKKIDVVAGFYKPIANSVFERCLSTYTCVMADKVTKDFLPSSRSVAFRKKVWKESGGYPEEIDTCEDLVFARRLKKKGYVFYVNKKAVVFWPQRDNIVSAFKQFFSYAVGDGKALYIRKQTPFLYLRVICSAILFLILITKPNLRLLNFIILLFFFYVAYSIIKNYKYVKNIRALIFLPILQLVSDIAVFLGMTFGVVQRLFTYFR